jgi:hypothetical protein
MRIVFKKRSAGQIEFGIIYGSMALIVLGAARVLPLHSIIPSCVFKGITGFPCPTCGTTRSMLSLSQGDIATALAMNPLIALGLVGAVLSFLYSIITLIFNLKRMSVILTGREKTVVRTIAVIFFLVQWTYLILTR